MDYSQALTAPFPPADINWRVDATTWAKGEPPPETGGRVRLVAYITARAAAARLDSVFGPVGWSCEYRPGPAGGVVCRISAAGAYKEGGAENTAREAVKGGLSDAFKRAAVQWGIGRYLYGLDSPWLPLDRSGPIYVGRSRQGTRFYCAQPRLDAPEAPSPAQRPPEAPNAPQTRPAAFDTAADLAAFYAAVSDLGWAPDELRAFLLWSGSKPPEQLPASARRRLYARLEQPDDALAAKLSAWLRERV